MNPLICSLTASWVKVWISGTSISYFLINYRLCCLQHYHFHSLCSLSLCYTFCRFLVLGKSQNQAFKFQDLNLTTKFVVFWNWNKRESLNGASFEMWMKNDDILGMALCNLNQLLSICDGKVCTFLHWWKLAFTLIASNLRWYLVAFRGHVTDNKMQSLLSESSHWLVSGFSN